MQYLSLIHYKSGKERRAKLLRGCYREIWDLFAVACRTSEIWHAVMSLSIAITVLVTSSFLLLGMIHT